MQERAADYRRLGAQGIWVVDPETRTGQMYKGETLITAEQLTVPGTTIHVEPPELFRSLSSSEQQQDPP